MPAAMGIRDRKLAEEINKTLFAISNAVNTTRDQEPKQEFFRINEKIDLAVSLLKKDLEKIEVTREYKPGVPELFADPGMIEHALINLLQNSIHATSKREDPRT